MLTVVESLGAVASRAPSLNAVEAPCGAATYAELTERALLLAAALREVGAGKGAIVGVCLPRSTEQIVALLACWKAGAAYLPLDPHWPEARLASLAQRAGCVAVVAKSARTGIFGTVPVVLPTATGKAVTDENPQASDLA